MNDFVITQPSLDNGQNQPELFSITGRPSVDTSICTCAPPINAATTLNHRLSVLNETIASLSMEIQLCQRTTLTNPMMRHQMKRKVHELHRQLTEKRLEREEKSLDAEYVGLPADTVDTLELSALNETIASLSMEIQLCQRTTLTNPMMRHQMKRKVQELYRQLNAKRLEREEKSLDAEHVGLPTDTTVSLELSALNETIASLSMEIQLCQRNTLDNPMMQRQMKRKVQDLYRQLAAKQVEREEKSLDVDYVGLPTDTTDTLDKTIASLSMEIQRCQHTTLTNPMMRYQMNRKVQELYRQLTAKQLERDRNEGGST
jgi:hypothetical protein